MKAWISPSAIEADLTNEVRSKAQALSIAAEKGARFLAITVDNNRDAATWLLASFHSPVTAVPLPPGLPVPALESRIAQLPTGGVVFASGLPLGKPSEPLPPLRPLTDLWVVLFTSGSSGSPKGIALSGNALRASAFAHADHSGFHESIWLLDLPLYHVGGLSVITRALFLETPLAIAGERFDAKRTSAWLASGLIHGLSLVPTTLFRLLELTPDFSRLHMILLGGAPAESSLVKKAVELGAPVRLTYGMTEHASQIATERSPGSGLEPLPGVELSISNDGEIHVRSPLLAAGHFQNGALEPLSKREGFFATGDLGSMENGKLKILGRMSELIITGGMKVFPIEIEREIGKLPSVADCAVYSRPDIEWGEVIYAAVVETNGSSFNSEEARRVLRDRLEPRKIPRRWMLVEKIPRSSTGKILRAEIPGLIPTRS